MEADTYLRFALALVFVLGLIGLLAWLARRAGLGGRVAKSVGSARRLSIIEVKQVDGKRRLVLVRRDGVEHLVMLGAQSETVIETGIEAPPEPEPAIAETTSFKDQVAAKMSKARSTKRARGGKATPAGQGAGAKA